MATAIKALGANVLAGVKANPAAYIVRLLRGIYATVIGSITFLWYSGWRRERVEPGTGQFPVPGLSKLKKKFPASLPDAKPDDTPKQPNAQTNPNPLNPALNAGTNFGKNAKGKHENFDPLRYSKRLDTAQKIARQFRLRITSGYRDPSRNAATPGASPTSLHMDGLAFDFVGSTRDMQACMAWARTQPEVFSEVMVHNAGTGLHVHLAFRPNAGM